MDNELATALSQLARALVYLGDIYRADVGSRVYVKAYRPTFAKLMDIADEKTLGEIIKAMDDDEEDA